MTPAARTPIGRIATVGRSTGPHLDWGMTWGDVKIGPALLTPAMPDPEKK